jgi:FKBP-type peptidyl-prolyl cis-trans isomerase FklB
MKVYFFAVVGFLFLVGQVNAQEKLELKSQKDKLSYIIGMDIGNDVRRQAVDVDTSIVMRGFTDALSGTRPLLSEQEIRETRAAFQKELMAKQEKQKEIGKKNKEYGEAFLAENKKREGVQTLPSGLQYKVIRPGAGGKPKLTDTVTVDYRAIWVNGTEFDSSYERGKPVTVQVNGVIPGWVEALQLMEVGAKWQLFVPSNLAYGEQGREGLIGPNMTLIFELELVSIQEKK